MKHDREIIYLAGFLFSLPLALTSYINSSYLQGFTSASYVGFVYIVSAVLTIFGFLKLPKILTHLGNRKAALTFSVLLFFSLLFLAFGRASFIVIPAFILYFISSNFLIASLDVFVEDFSQKRRIGGIRGTYLSLTSLAWVAAQVISGSIILKSSLAGLYLISAMFMALVSTIFILFLHDFVDPKYKKVPTSRTIKSFIANKHLSKIFLINLILKFFYSWMIIYTPIYLHEYMGFAWGKIGIIFSIMLIPFVVLDFPLGKLSDKIGEKKILILGFLFAAFFTSIIPLINVPSVAIFALVLFATRIGAASIETMSESYFFKCISEEDADLISFFRNTTPLSFILGPALAIPVLFFVPEFSHLYFALGTILLAGLLTTLRLEDIR